MTPTTHRAGPVAMCWAKPESTSSTVSKRVIALERRLGVVLLHRTTRRVEPTEAGTRFGARCAAIVAEAEAAAREACGEYVPAGLVVDPGAPRRHDRPRALEDSNDGDDPAHRTGG